MGGVGKAHQFVFEPAGFEMPAAYPSGELETRSGAQRHHLGQALV